MNGQRNSNGTGTLPTPGGINSRNISEATNSPTGTGQNIYSAGNNGFSNITKRKSNNVVNGVTDGGAAIRAQYDRHGNKLDSVELPSVGQTRSAIHTSVGAASMAGNRNSLGNTGPNGNGHHMQLQTGIINKAAAAAPIIVQRNQNEYRDLSNQTAKHTTEQSGKSRNAPAQSKTKRDASDKRSPDNSNFRVTYADGNFPKAASQATE